MKKNKCVLGIDVGATTVKLGLVKRNGRIFSKTSFSTKLFIKKRAFIAKIIETAKLLIKENNLHNSDLAGIGIGVPGIVDYKNGIVYELTNIKGWKEITLGRILRSYFQVPVIVDNDANAFAMGQLAWGAALGVKDAICVTLGSGVGGGIIINGKIYRGSASCAGEIGHICIDANGPKCGCGRRGCLEAFVGNKYIVKRAKKYIKSKKRTILINMAGGKLSRITPELITKAAKKKDLLAIEVLKETGSYLGVGLAGIVNVLNPKMLIIGGGVSKAGEFIFTSLIKQLNITAMKPHLKGLKIIRASFPDEAGIIGAAALVL
ncbi:MAG: ROK family protein [Candidatus Omnitrophota bacterium]